MEIDTEMARGKNRGLSWTALRERFAGAAVQRGEGFGEDGEEEEEEEKGER